MPTIPAKCQPLADDLDKKEMILDELMEEYKGTSEAEKTRIFYEMRAAMQAVGDARRALDQCINPPTPLPDLSAADVTIQWHADKKAFDFAILIHCEGAPVSGPFVTAVSVTYEDYSQNPPLEVNRNDNLSFPSYIWMVPGDTRPSEYFKDVPYLVRPGSSMPPTYIFDAVVDSNFQINESNEENNILHKSVILRPPRIVLPPIGPLKG